VALVLLYGLSTLSGGAYLLRFTDAEWIAIETNLQDCKPCNKEEWRVAVAVGLNIGRVVQREIELNALLKELHAVSDGPVL